MVRKRWRVPPGFTEQVIDNYTDYPYAVFAADMDGDGDIDVLSGEQYSVYWHENDGQDPPGFTRRTISWEPETVKSVFAVDLDGDGDMDALCSDEYGAHVWWFENDGAQNFTEHPIYDAAYSARAVFPADMDGDGDVDVLSASYGDRRLRWYANDGLAPPSFTPHEVATFSGTQGQAVFAADLDADVIGKGPDNYTVAWYENDFAAWSVNTDVFSPTITDAVADASDGDWILSTITEFNGGSDFNCADKALTLQSFAGIHQPAEAGYTLADDTLLTTSPRRTMWVGPNEVVLAESTHDATLDGTLAVSAGSVADVETPNLTVGGTGLIELGVASGLYATVPDGVAVQGDLSLAPGATLATVSDLTLDDIGMVFTPRQVSTDAGGAQCVTVADVDGDGLKDIVAALANDGDIFWYENDGALGFTPHAIFTDGVIPLFVHAVGLDDDDDTDVLSLDIIPGNLRWHENDGASPPGFVTHDLAEVAFSHSLSTADLDGDGDGDTDIAYTSPAADTLRWLENDGVSPPTFVPQVIDPSVPGPESVYAIDLDGDDDSDIVCASSDDHMIRWYENDGAVPPTFTSHVIFADGYWPYTVFAIDLDEDGDNDVLSASISYGPIRWYENDGLTPPSFTTHEVIPYAASIIDVHAFDVDDDGDIDVVSASLENDAIRWYESDGQTPPTFTPHDVALFADGVTSVFATDMDDDGDGDIVASSIYDDTIRLFERRAPHSELSVAARLVSAGSVTNDRGLFLGQASLLDADQGLVNNGQIVSDFGNVVGDTLNTGGAALTIAGSTQLVGNLVNEGLVAVGGVLAVSGALMNNGVIAEPGEGGGAGLRRRCVQRGRPDPRLRRDAAAGRQLLTNLQRAAHWGRCRAIARCRPFTFEQIVPQLCWFDLGLAQGVRVERRITRSGERRVRERGYRTLHGSVDPIADNRARKAERRSA